MSFAKGIFRHKCQLLKPDPVHNVHFDFSKGCRDVKLDIIRHFRDLAAIGSFTDGIKICVERPFKFKHDPDNILHINLVYVTAATN